MRDAWRAYLEMALGLTEASRKKAERAVKNLLGKGVGKGQATAALVQTRVEELMETSRVNREALAKLVRYEVDRTLGAVGLATSEEISELTERVRRLERQLQETPPEPAAAPVATATVAKAPAKTVAKKTAAKTVAKKSPAKVTAKKTAGAKKTTGKSTAAPRTAGTGGA